MSGDSLNYDFMIDMARRLSGSPSGRILDFGCGKGRAVVMGRAKGLDMVGADSFDGCYRHWGDAVDPAAAGHVLRIEDGRIPYPDEHFDVVLSNMVFEHIADPRPALAEVRRVLKPGGAFLAFFPTGDVWYEGHVGIYFPHWMRRLPKLRHRYLMAARRSGLGLYGEGMTPGQWVRHMEDVIDTMVCYHAWPDVRRWWREAFGSEPQCIGREFIRHRIAAHPRARRLSALARAPLSGPLLDGVCRVRAGRVLLVRKPAAGLPDAAARAA